MECEHSKMQFIEAKNLPEPDENGMTRHLIYQCLHCGKQIVIAVDNETRPPRVLSLRNAEFDEEQTEETITGRYPIYDNGDYFSEEETEEESNLTKISFSIQTGKTNLNFSTEMNIKEIISYAENFSDVTQLAQYLYESVTEKTALTKMEHILKKIFVEEDEGENKYEISDDIYENASDDIKVLLDKAKNAIPKEGVYTAITKDCHVEYYQSFAEVAKASKKKHFLVLWSEEIPIADAQMVAEYIYDSLITKDMEQKDK